MAKDLPPSSSEREQIRREAEQITMLAVRYACPLLIAPPPSLATTANTASAVVVEFQGEYRLLTAAHVLRDTRTFRKDDPSITWHLAGETLSTTIEPEDRLIYYDLRDDVMALRLSADEAAATEKLVCHPRTWSPPRPPVGEYVFFCGYPATERIQVSERFYSFAPACIGGAIDSSGGGRFGIRFERERWLTYREGVSPSLGDRLGGMSGGPIFSLRGLSVELVGIITDHSDSYDIMLAASLEALSNIFSDSAFSA